MAEFLYFKYLYTKDYSEIFILVNEIGEAFLYAESKKKTDSNKLMQI